MIAITPWNFLRKGPKRSGQTKDMAFVYLNCSLNQTISITSLEEMDFSASHAVSFYN